MLDFISHNFKNNFPGTFLSNLGQYFENSIEILLMFRRLEGQRLSVGPVNIADFKIWSLSIIPASCVDCFICHFAEINETVLLFGHI